MILSAENDDFLYRLELIRAKHVKVVSLADFDLESFLERQDQVSFIQ